MRQIIIFAGTTEGRTLAWELGRQGVSLLVCTATEYGGRLVEQDRERWCEEEKGALKVHAGRLTEEEMEELFRKEQPELVLDATHPYAALASENIHRACERSGREYLRLIRREVPAPEEECIRVADTREAVAYLRQTTGNVLLTTGSKELMAFTELPDYAERLYARVLSTPEVAEACSRMGFQGQHLICMQGPFSRELNIAMLRQVDARYLVTKESGKAGGFPEKLAAAREAGAQVILIGRPPEQPGESLESVCKILEKRFRLSRALIPADQGVELLEKGKALAGQGVELLEKEKALAGQGVELREKEASEGKVLAGQGLELLEKNSPRQVILAGIGMGVRENMTREVWEACLRADCLIGAERMLECVEGLGKPMYVSYRPAEIREYLLEHPAYGSAVVLLSGDVGFYSGAKGLLEALKEPEFQVSLLPGISSVVYLCSRLKISWEDIKLLSVHGRRENLVAAVRENPRVFTLLSGSQSVQELCRELTEYGLGEVELIVGEKLHYGEERLVRGKARELTEQKFDSLCAALLENPQACRGIQACLEDEAFLRGKAPMTKSEVRGVSVAKLRLTRDGVVYDVGAGTGSVSVEMALQVSEGLVYAVERQEEAAGLIEENMRRFAVPNIRVIRGKAPEALRDLPVPTHAFIGGSAGKLREILALLLEKNPRIRVVINAVTLETLGEMERCLRELPFEEVEILQLTVAKARTLGGYHLMTGQNPVYIISCTGRGE